MQRCISGLVSCPQRDTDFGRVSELFCKFGYKAEIQQGVCYG